MDRRGLGRGVGGQRQGDGGAVYCVCPKCGSRHYHSKGTPCQSITCSLCGSQMMGAD